MIDGKIIRAGFKLKYNINLSNQINLPPKFQVLAGDFFTFEKFEIIEEKFVNMLSM